VSGGRGSAAKIQIAERRQRALALRRENISYRTIADLLRPEYPGYVHTTVFKDVQAELVTIRTKTGEIAEDVRQMELERLDVMQHALWDRIEAGDVRAIDTALRVCERRSKLLGLDAPTRTDLTSDGESLNVRVVLRANDDSRTADAAPGTIPGAE
jgi:hypothetical protein